MHVTLKQILWDIYMYNREILKSVFYVGENEARRFVTLSIYTWFLDKKRVCDVALCVTHFCLLCDDQIRIFFNLSVSYQHQISNEPELKPGLVI